MTGYQPSLFDLYQFEYTTVQRLRDEGLTDAVTYTDAIVRKLIRRFSKLVNRVTAQWFWPLENKVRLDGPVSNVISSPDLVPILELRGMEFYGESSTSVVDAATYRIGEREIWLNGRSAVNHAGFWSTSRTTYPPYNLNVVLDGTFGWLENRPYAAFDAVSKITTTTTALLTSGTSTSVTLASVAGIQERSVLIFRAGAAGSSYAGHAIVTTVTVGTNTVTFDAINLNVATLASGANVITYGMVPEPVEDAVVRLVVLYKDKLASAAAAQSSNDASIIEERVDNYHYKYADSVATAVAVSTTGDIEIDRLLRDYAHPNYVGGV